MFQGCFKKVSRMSQGSLKVVPGIFNGVLRVFQVCFKEVSRAREVTWMSTSKIEGCFEGILRVF